MNVTGCSYIKLEADEATHILLRRCPDLGCNGDICIHARKDQGRLLAVIGGPLLLTRADFNNALTNYTLKVTNNVDLHVGEMLQSWPKPGEGTRGELSTS